MHSKGEESRGWVGGGGGGWRGEHAEVCNMCVGVENEEDTTVASEPQRRERPWPQHFLSKKQVRVVINVCIIETKLILDSWSEC